MSYEGCELCGKDITNDKQYHLCDDCYREGYSRNTLRKQVKAFHLAMEVKGDRKTPGRQSPDIVRLRARLIAEEFLEFLRAVGVQVSETTRMWIESDIEEPIDEQNLPEIADALADLDYVVEGTRLAFGIDGGPVADAVHAANMEKANGPRREDGKVLKPEGWKPPDIAAVLVKQGWEP